MSSDYEGLPKVLIEAIGIGTAVVSTDCPSGPREIIGNGKAGILVPKGDTQALANAIGRILNEQNQRNRFVAEGFRRAEDFQAASVTR